MKEMEEFESSRKLHMLNIILTILIIDNLFIGPVLGSDGILAPCHKYFVEEEGKIVSPGFPEGYPPSVRCTYDIARQNDDNCGVRLTFEDFDLQLAEKDGFCKRDWLAIDSCVPEGGNRFCGRIKGVSYEYPFQADAQGFRLIFKTDNVTQSRGFHIKYKIISDCRHGLYWDPPVSIIPGVDLDETECFTQVTERKGTINTPYFPRHYPNNMDCVYEFLRDSPVTCGIRMRVLTFDLEKSIDTELGGACSDFFHLVGGCGFLCGNVRFIWTAKFQPGATSLKFHFHSDEKKTRPGFQIAFEQVYDCS